MRLKSFLWVVSFALLLNSCIAKKKRSYAQAKKDYEKSSAQGSKPNALPDENTAGFTTYTFNSAEEYIRTFAPIALEEMEAYGIPASITLAQGLLESGAGSSNLVRKSNNHFGIKCHTKWRGPSTTHDDDEKGECFRKYLHPRESYRDHSLFLANGSRYAFLFDYRTTDYKAWARGLKKAGYATDPKYPAKLIAQIQKYNLDQYDHPRKAQRIIKENNENRTPNLAFLKIIPFMLEGRTSITYEGIKAKLKDFEQMDDISFQFLNAAVGKMTFGVKELVKVIDGQEVRAEMQFPNGASGIFVVHDAFEAFIKE